MRDLRVTVTLPRDLDIYIERNHQLILRDNLTYYYSTYNYFGYFFSLHDVICQSHNILKWN